MSFKSQALRDLVVERLAVAADEILALFERTFAEYEEEFLRSKSAQEPREELTIVRPLSVPLDVQQTPESIQEEQKPSIIKEEPSSDLAVSPPVKFDKNFEKPTSLHQETVNDLRQETIVNQSAEEEPGCSLDLQSGNDKISYNCSDTDDSNDWEPAANTQSNNNEEDPDLVLIEESSPRRNDENTLLSFPSFSAHSSLQNQGLFSVSTPTLKSGKKTYKCSVCSKVFDQKAHLKQHMQEEKSFSCPECGLRLTNKHKMHRHISAVHRKEKPHKCSFCQSAFAQKSNLMSHMRTHTGERPFVCMCCGKDFRSRALLNKHIQTHALEESYFCENASSIGQS